MTFTNSPLATYKNLVKPFTANRGHAIDTITIHCVVGQTSVESLANTFNSRDCSANYGIGYDGRIGLYVEEKDRSWCSSNRENDDRAITIECASDATEPYAVNDAVYKSLILLLVDICKRNGIKKLLWKGDKSLIGQVEKQNMTVHRWFNENKSCPGTYLYSKHSQIAEEVNSYLMADTHTEEKPLYRVRKTWADQKSQIGAFRDLANAKKICDNNSGYSVFDEHGNAVYVNQIDLVPVAKAVIRGEYGNGAERVRKLTEAGYDAVAVQTEVNKILYK